MNKEYSKLSKNALKSMRLTSIISSMIVAVVLIVVWRLLFPNEKWAMIVVFIVIVLLILDIFVTPHIRFNRYKYYIDDECIDIKEGLIYIVRNIVPIERIHKIAVSRGPIDRAFGLGKVKVTTAGGDVIIRFLQIDKAEKIAEALKHRINQIVAKDRENQ